MESSAKEEREKRAKREMTKLNRLLRELPKERAKAAEGLAKRIAFMTVTLEDLEADINENGTVEPFSQTENIVYDRQRPAAQIYNSIVRNYSSACKQFLDFFPDNKNTRDATDELMDFVKKKKATVR